MGIDLLAFSFDAEKRFRVRLDIRTFIERVRGSGRTDATVQELFDWLAEQVAAQKAAMPHDAWQRFLDALRPAAWDMRGLDIHPEDFLMRDLGLTG
jgi:hypothetical protein